MAWYSTLDVYNVCLLLLHTSIKIQPNSLNKLIILKVTSNSVLIFSTDLNYCLAAVEPVGQRTSLSGQRINNRAIRTNEQNHNGASDVYKRFSTM